MRSFFCRFLFWWALTSTITLHGQSEVTAPAPDQGSLPNIVVIMADDHGQWASEVYGNRDLKTPNMQWLASQGVTFSQAYAVSPVCSPSRASFFTGRMPSQHGVHDFLSESPEYDHGWIRNELLLSQILQQAGYQTALVGKWHATTNSAPVQRGFDFWFSYDVGPAGWQNQYQHRGPIHFSDQGEPVIKHGFQSQRLTDQAIRFMDRQSTDSAFFLFLGYVDTHAPFVDQPERLVAPFRNRTLSGVPLGLTGGLPPRGEANRIPADHNEQLAQYYAGVEVMDQQIGRIIDYLEARNMLDNTLIIYTSDHGHLNGHHGVYGKGNATRPQNFYQESILVPLILTWPQGLPKNKKMANPVGTCDLHQTILDAAKVSLNQTQKDTINSPGKSVLSLIREEQTKWNTYKFCELGNARMIANDRYKYVHRLPPLVGTFTGELYDLDKDPQERQNILGHASYEDIAAVLKTKLEAYFDRYQEPEHTGINLSAQPPANANEQWRTP